MPRLWGCALVEEEARLVQLSVHLSVRPRQRKCLRTLLFSS